MTKDIILSAIGLAKSNVITRQLDEYIIRNRICHLDSGPYANKNIEFIKERGQIKNKTIKTTLLFDIFSLKDTLSLILNSFTKNMIKVVIDIISRIISYIRA